MVRATFWIIHNKKSRKPYLSVKYKKKRETKQKTHLVIIEGLSLFQLECNSKTKKTQHKIHVRNFGK